MSLLLSLFALAQSASAAPIGTVDGQPIEPDWAQQAWPNGVLLAASVAGRTALGARAGAEVRRLQRAHERPFRRRRATTCTPPW